MIVISLVALFYFVRYLITPNSGLIDNYPEALLYNGEMVFSPKALFSPLVKAGAKPGSDVIMKAGDLPVKNTRDLIKAAFSVTSFRPYEVVVKKKDGGLAALTVMPQLNLMRMDWIFFFLFIVVLGFTAFYLIFHFPESFAYNILAIACSVYLLVACVKPFFYENIYSIILIHIGTTTPWLLVIFSIYYPQKRAKLPVRIIAVSFICLYYLAFLVLRLYAFHNWMLHSEESWYNLFRNAGRINNVFNGGAYIIFVLRILYIYRKGFSIRMREQFRWLLAGFILSLSVYYCFEEFPFILGELPGKRINFGNISLFFLTPFPLFFLAGFAKNKRINYRSVKIGIIVHGVLIVTIFFAFSVLYLPLKNYFLGNNGLPCDIAGFIPVVILFLILFPLYNICRRIVERIFYASVFSDPVHQVKQLENECLELRLNQENRSLRSQVEMYGNVIPELQNFLSGLIKMRKKNIRATGTAIAAIERACFSIGTGADEGDSFFHEVTGAMEPLKHICLVENELLEKLKGFLKLNKGVLTKVSSEYIIGKSIMEVKRFYKDMNIRHISNTAVRFECFPGEIVLVLVNILANAREAATEPGLEIIIESSGGEGDLRINIKDRGTGLENFPEKKLFSPFFTTKPGHFGLGLYLAQLAVRKNGGHISFSSGEETTVGIVLPLTHSNRGEFT